jgi:hypothetical protein
MGQASSVVVRQRGSNPARIRVIRMVRQERAEIFALPFAHTSDSAPPSSFPFPRSPIFVCAERV